LVSDERRRELVDGVWKHQRADGGWSIRTFAAPEAWGNGSRAAKLKAEPEFATTPSDGHQTGLAVIVLRDAGVEANDPRLEKAARWLLANQRVSGRWWTRSLNTDGPHYITYSGTAFPLLALAKCGKLPEARTAR
jgi:squalene-hopene/tetraprenyl-beta-curcumene cyclase